MIADHQLTSKTKNSHLISSHSTLLLRPSIHPNSLHQETKHKVQKKKKKEICKCKLRTEPHQKPRNDNCLALRTPKEFLLSALTTRAPLDKPYTPPETDSHREPRTTSDVMRDCSVVGGTSEMGGADGIDTVLERLWVGRKGREGGGLGRRAGDIPCGYGGCVTSIGRQRDGRGKLHASESNQISRCPLGKEREVSHQACPSELSWKCQQRPE